MTHHYAALWRMRQVYPQFGGALRRYVLGGGEYPVDWRVRTPLGMLPVTLFHADDFLTLNEVFCRCDYAAPDDIRAVVDIGSNIGISALYFLTRNEHVQCYLYEPDARNVSRLRQNLRGFENRYELEEVAVGTSDGIFSFGREPTGRYGGIGVSSSDVVDVRCRDVNAVLADVLAHHEEIDILKLDTEGLELETIEGIEEQFLDRVRLIYFETDEPAPRVHPERFSQSRRGLREVLRRRRS